MFIYNLIHADKARGGGQKYRKTCDVIFEWLKNWLTVVVVGYGNNRMVPFLDPETGLQALRTLLLFFLGLLLVLRLFHFTTDRCQISHTD